MTLSVSFLDGRVVGVFMRNEECGLDVATVGVFTFAVKDFLVQFDVVVVNSIIESNGDHLGDISSGQVTRDDGTVLGAEAVRQHTLGGVARRRPVGVVVDIYDKQRTTVIIHTNTYQSDEIIN